MRRFLLILLAALPLSGLAACDDPTSYLTDPNLREDTLLVLRAPGAPGGDAPTAPSALDGTVPTEISPELPQFAGQWDFALRQSGSTFRFVAIQTGSSVSRPGLAPSSTDYAAIDEASRRRSVYTDTAVVLTAGASYTFRTRQYPARGRTCVSYGKMRVDALDPARGQANLRVLTNINCDDERLED